MNQKNEKLKTLLKELFQLDQPDIDFGLYRVMKKNKERTRCSEILNGHRRHHRNSVLNRHEINSEES